MNEIDLIRRFRATEATKPDEEQTQRARDALTEAIKEDAVPVKRRRLRTRGGAITIALLALALPAGYAIASEAGVFGGDDGTVRITPETAIPAPPPALSQESDCPANVQDFLRELMTDPSLLPQYSDLRGYPVAGCPTLDELEALFEERSRSAPPGAGPIELPPPYSAPGGSGAD